MINHPVVGAVRDALVRTDRASSVSISRSVARSLARTMPDADPVEYAGLVQACLDDVLGAGPLELLLADPTVTEIMYIGKGCTYIERNGHLEEAAVLLDDETVVALVQRMVTPLGLRFDRSAPVVDARLLDGSRVHAVLPPLAVDGPCLTIRRFAAKSWELSAFGVSNEIADLLGERVRSGWNLLVSGATSSGKTSFLAALTQWVPAGARVVTIEDTAELQLLCPHVVRLEARPANSEGVGAVTIRDLVRAALRMRPDRIIVGEVRGPEAFDMLQACNTGHDGSSSSVHANSPRAALIRLAALAALGAPTLAGDVIQSHLALGLDTIVHVARTADGCRRVVAIADLETHDGRCSARVFGRFGPRGCELVDAPRVVPGRFDA